MNRVKLASFAAVLVLSLSKWDDTSILACKLLDEIGFITMGAVFNWFQIVGMLMH